MTRSTVILAGIVVVFLTAALSRPVTFDSPFSVKNDPEIPPTDAGAIQDITPSE